MSPRRVGMDVACPTTMRPVEPARWDDYVLAGLLLLISVPRLVLAVSYDHPLGVEDTMSMIMAALALLVVIPRRRRS